MSIKIHNGFILNIRTADIFEAANTIRKEMQTVARHLLRDAAVGLIISEHDLQKATGCTAEESFNVSFERFLLEYSSKNIFSSMFTLWKNNKMLAVSSMLGYHQEYCKGSMQDIPAYNYNCQIQVYRVFNKVLCRVWAENEVYMDAFGMLPFSKEYNYFDNYDKPAEISNAEWEERGSTWNRILSPDQEGLTIDCLPSSFCLELYLTDEISNFDPSAFMDTTKRGEVILNYLVACLGGTNQLSEKLMKSEIIGKDADTVKFLLEHPEQIREQIIQKIGNESWAEILRPASL